MKPNCIATTLDNLHSTLRMMRKHNRWTLKDVAQMTGLSLSFLSDIERGNTMPSFDTIQKLTDVYCKGIVICVMPSND